MVYIGIFIAKVVEVALATLRMVLVTKGERVKGACVAFFEVSIWLVITGAVLDSIKEDPLRGLVYVLGYVCGTFLGSCLEEKLALGVVTVNIVVSREDSEEVSCMLDSLEIGYTTLSAQGRKIENKFIVAYIPRKRSVEVLTALQNLKTKCFVTVNESKGTLGGYGIKRK